MKLKFVGNKKSKCVVVKCSCGCKRVVKIYYPEKIKDDLFEIGGVLGTRDEWERLLERVGL